MPDSSASRSAHPSASEGWAQAGLLRLPRVPPTAATATRNVGCVSLICNVARTAEILERAFGVLKREEIPVLMMSQGASKTNISLIVGGEGTGPKAIRALHAQFFE